MTGGAEGRESLRDLRITEVTQLSREPFRWRFAKLSPNTRVRWECVEGPGAAAGTTVTFRLTETPEGQTLVECDREGLAGSHEAFTTCNTLWGILMGHLKNYAETAKPAPAFS